MKFSIVDIDDALKEVSSFDHKKYEKRELKKAKSIKDSAEAKAVASKFLEENPHVNIGFIIEHLQNLILSTTKSSEKLGVSPTAFSRLRKKYNISPVYTVKNNKEDKLGKKSFPFNASKFAIRNFYTSKQLELIPQTELELVQLRAARSLKNPNGKGVPWKWTSRGYHPNGKLKARTSKLTKYGVRVIYDSASDNYMVMLPDKTNKVLNKKEVDKLNYQYDKLKAFL